jgi:orotidine-5'-phosphate decarboxylase
MNKAAIVQAIKNKRSFLCVGLDTDINKIPKFLLKEEDPIFEFNKRVIDATKHVAVAYKPNLAFYECHGPAGWESLRKTMEYIPEGIFTIADAKRGDIGNTSNYYAQTFFNYYNFDSVTVAPYMGSDSVSPFLDFPEKWVILLALTSNKGALDFQDLTLNNGKQLFEEVIEKSITWGTPENLMFVVGATHGEKLAEVRKVAKNNFFLVPGVGAQGGSLEDVVKYGSNEECGLLVNSSRGIIYAGGDTPDFEVSIKQAAEDVQEEMDTLLKKYLNW